MDRRWRRQIWLAYQQNSTKTLTDWVIEATGLRLSPIQRFWRAAAIHELKMRRNGLRSQRRIHKPA